MFERFTDQARRVLVLAQEEARLAGASFIGPEHLLLGLLHEGESPAARSLLTLGVTIEAAREEIARVSGPSGGPAQGSPPFTPRAKKALERALRASMQLGNTEIGPAHLLLGLVADGAEEHPSVAVQVLERLGAPPEQVEEAVRSQLQAEPAGPRRAGSARAARPPVCARCGAGLDTSARFRVLEVPPGDGEGEAEAAVRLRVVFCGECGASLGVQGMPEA